MRDYIEPHQDSAVSPRYRYRFRIVSVATANNTITISFKHLFAYKNTKLIYANRPAQAIPFIHTVLCILCFIPNKYMCIWTISLHAFAPLPRYEYEFENKLTQSCLRARANARIHTSRYDKSVCGFHFSKIK